ncbi:MAG: hypothetical protein ACHQRM_01270 [Bacteroidia bacterium]
MNKFLLIAFLGSLDSFSISAQNIDSLVTYSPYETLQDSFCACVNRHAGEESKDWGDAVAYSILLKLDVNTTPYQDMERLLRKSYPAASLSALDRKLDSLVITQSFGKCLSLWKVILKDPPGFFKMVQSIRDHPPLLQNQLPHMRTLTGQNLLNYMRSGVSDSAMILFNRQTTFDSARGVLEEISNSIREKKVRAEIKFEKLGRDSCGIAKVKLLQDGTHSLGGIRIQFRRNDHYAKIERISALIRDDFKEEEPLVIPH